MRRSRAGRCSGRRCWSCDPARTAGTNWPRTHPPGTTGRMVATLPLSHRTRRAEPPRFMFCPLTEQMANVRRWNDDREWGFTDAELAAVDLSPRTHADPLVVDLIAVYLDAAYLGDD